MTDLLEAPEISTLCTNASVVEFDDGTWRMLPCGHMSCDGCREYERKNQADLLAWALEGKTVYCLDAHEDKGKRAALRQKIADQGYDHVPMPYEWDSREALMGNGLSCSLGWAPEGAQIVGEAHERGVTVYTTCPNVGGEVVPADELKQTLLNSLRLIPAGKRCRPSENLQFTRLKRLRSGMVAGLGEPAKAKPCAKYRIPFSEVIARSEEMGYRIYLKTYIPHTGEKWECSNMPAKGTAEHAEWARVVERYEINKSRPFSIFEPED